MNQIDQLYVVIALYAQSRTILSGKEELWQSVITPQASASGGF
jgi:hypothetical protein